MASIKAELLLFLVLESGLHEACVGDQRRRPKTSSRCVNFPSLIFCITQIEPWQPPAPYGANTRPTMANEGSYESPGPPLATDEPGAMIGRQ